MNFPISVVHHRLAIRVGRFATERSQPADKAATPYKRHAGCCLMAKAGLRAQRYGLDDGLRGEL